jgi:hypothetical protein
MKKYIYGTILVAAVAAVVIFFYRPPETTNQPPQNTLELTFRFPAGYEFTENAPFLLTHQAEYVDGKVSIPTPDKRFNPLISPYKLAFAPDPNAIALVLNARLYYCDKATRMCFQDDFKARVPLAAGTTSPLSYTWDITPQKPAYSL